MDFGYRFTFVSRYRFTLVDFGLPIVRNGVSVSPTVSFHDFKSQNFKLSVSNPKSKYVAYLSVLSQNSNRQSLGRKIKHEIFKTDRSPSSPARCWRGRWGLRHAELSHFSVKATKTRDMLRALLAFNVDISETASYATPYHTILYYAMLYTILY